MCLTILVISSPFLPIAIPRKGATINSKLLINDPLKWCNPLMADPIRILCVEDSVNVQQMLSFILRKAGYEPHIANNGWEAIKKAEDLRPNLILMDIMMPDLSGIQAIQQIKSDPVNTHIPILVLSAYTSPQLISQAMEAGATRYKKKTIIPDELIRIIRSYLKDGNTEKKNVLG